MSEKLKILYLEDDPVDGELVRENLLAQGAVDIELLRVGDREAFEAALAECSFQLVLADYSVPGFDGMAALEMVRARDKQVPFIFVSGSMGEELAVQALRNGATDYVLKDRLTRLLPSIQRALEEAQIRRDQLSAERALRESEQRLELALRGADLGLWDWDVQTGKVYFNKRWAGMLGYGLAEVEEHIRAWENLMHPEDTHHAMAAFWSHVEGRTQGIDCEYRLKTKSGGWCWVLCRGGVVERGPDGAALRATGTHLDITPRKEAEAASAMFEAQLRQVQKMDALGTMAGGIAHDFNNILGAIIGYSELVRSELDHQTEVQADIGEVLKAANRAKLLVQQILTFSRQQTQDLKPIRVPDVVREAMNLLRATIPTTVDVRINLSPATPVILGDSTQIHQIIMNLAANSVHALPDRNGFIEVDVAPVEIDEPWAEAAQRLRPGLHARLTVRDNGHGMDESVQQRIFDPFFTTKGPGAGTGLGLAVVHGIVQKHRGIVRVQSQLGEGTCIDIIIPASETQECPVSVDGRDFVSGGGRRVLLVEDEPSLAKVSSLMLERLGFSVQMHVDSQEAWEAFKADPGTYDLVITDQTMPRMAGLELSSRILEQRPDIPVLLVTGFHASVSPRRLREAGLAKMLMKPYTIQELSEAIREVAGSAS